MNQTSSVSASSITAMDLPSSVSANSTTASAEMDQPSSVSAGSTTAEMNLPSSVSAGSSTVSAVKNLTSSVSASSTTAVMDLPSSVSSSSTTVSAIKNMTSSVSASSTTVLTEMDQPSSVSAGSTTVAMNLTSSVSANSTTVSSEMDLPSSVSASSTTVSAEMDQPSSVSVGSTTVPVYEYAIDCLPIKDPQAILNTTSVADGTVVHVSCQPSYKLVVPRTNTEFFTCLGGRWIPLTPQCNPAENGVSAPVGVIVGCTVGGFICLVLVIVALFMLHKSVKERKEQRERNKEFNDKMDQIGFYLNTTFQDPVGMPVLTMDTRDTDLRGRVALTTNNPSASSEKEEPPDAGKLGADLF